MRLTLAIAATGVCWVGISSVFFPPADIPWSQGKILFGRLCAECHTIEPGVEVRYAPDLSRIGAEAGDRIPGMSAEDYLIQSIVDPVAFRRPEDVETMPPFVAAKLSPRQVVSVAGYLMTLGGRVDYRRLASRVGSVRVPRPPDSTAIDLAVAEAGRRIFFHKGECIRCHDLRHLPGSSLRAPSLLGAAKYDAPYLEESIRTPSKSIRKGYETWNVALANGLTQSGRLMGRSGEVVNLLADSTEGVLELKSIPVGAIRKDRKGDLDIRRSEISAMPNDLLTNEEIRLVVAFLQTL